MQVDFEHVKMAVALRTARAAVGWSQDELARVTGIPKTTIARFETMEGGLKAAQLAALINTYNSKGIDVEFLRGNKVTIKIDELVFKRPVKVGNLIKIYGKVIEFGRTSVSLYIEVRKHNVYTGEQDVVTHTNIKFVKIDDDGNSVPIQDYVKNRYSDRLKKFGRGLLSSDEIKLNLLSEGTN